MSKTEISPIEKDARLKSMRESALQFKEEAPVLADFALKYSKLIDALAENAALEHEVLVKLKSMVDV